LVSICRLLQKPLEDSVLKEIVTEAVDIEREFICESLPCNLIGMNADLMKRYIEFVADRLVVALGATKIYNTPNPFSWMEQISLQCVSGAILRVANVSCAQYHCQASNIALLLRCETVNCHAHPGT
jgi:hypothetical protein